MADVRLIDANEIVKVAEHAYNEWNLAMAAADGKREINNTYKMQELCKAVKAVADAAPTIDAVPVTAAELKHLINDTIAYIWSLEDRGCDKAEYGYDSRKALLEKLKQFERDHFPELDCGCGG